MTKFLAIEALYPSLLHYLTAYKFEEVLRLLLLEADSDRGVIGLAISLPLNLVDALNLVENDCFDVGAYGDIVKSVSTAICYGTDGDHLLQIANFLEISSLFQYGENQEEAVMLRTFPFLFSGESKTWLNELDGGTITSWTKLREAFISRYFSLAKFKRLLYDIHNFHQLGNETLVEAWTRLKEMLRMCYGHGLTKGTIVHIFYHGLNGPTQQILNAGGIFLYNTPNEAFKILEDKFLLKLYFLEDSQNTKPKTVVPVGGNNINSNHAILMEKYKALTSKINSEFLIIRKELKEMRDGRRDNHASQIYMKDDTLMCEPHEANYV
nr:reverse transcriptase domain-containing protein [Tanacetum cinerariifolium]